MIITKIKKYLIKKIKQNHKRFTKYLFFFAINISIVNCIYASLIDRSCLDNLDNSCSYEEIQYINWIVNKEISYLGGYNYLALYEIPKIKKINDNSRCLIATLAIFNGFVWDYKFVYDLKQNQITGTRQRKGHNEIENVVQEIDIFVWLKSFLDLSCILV